MVGNHEATGGLVVVDGVDHVAIVDLVKRNQKRGVDVLVAEALARLEGLEVAPHVGVVLRDLDVRVGGGGVLVDHALGAVCVVQVPVVVVVLDG